MILYGSTMSPFVRKVAAFAAEKGIEIDLQQTGFPNHTPEFLAASPFKKMPAIADGDYLLSDSSAIIHYLEAKFPEPEMIPTEPRARGRVIWFDEFADTLLFACGAKIFFNKVVAPRFLGRIRPPRSGTGISRSKGRLASCARRAPAAQARIHIEVRS